MVEAKLSEALATAADEFNRRQGRRKAPRRCDGSIRG